ncbi:hypothetical protein RJ640_008362 [Escallonia rubra]|uniref:Small auxin up regulated protein n=1 Tax=Escallonia rubra TaxID=112253 RepID=A0AA88UCA4_9ASTE|nr:hypothetical protein RJ640_008362 [Escallonia rubra]
MGAPAGVRRLRSGPQVLAPRGYVPISVGVNDETRRFIVHTTALGDAEFLQFLGRSAEEYGFCNQGILRIPYEANAFEEWMSKGAKQKSIRVRPT